MKKLVTLLAVGLLLSATACTPQLGNARASSDVPDASQVDEISIPYDPGLPMYAVAVQPLKFSVGAVSGTTIIDGKPSKVDIDYKAADSQTHVITSQLTSALSNVGNIALLDDGALNHKSGKVSAALKKGEKGPFVISGTITEFNENAAGGDSTVGGSLGGAGAVVGIAGAITGNRALTWTGAGVAAANPTYEESEAERVGMVAIDFKITDGKTGRIVKAFNTRGSFTAQSASSGFSLFGIGKTQRKFQSSAVGQAMRVAINDAATKTFNALKGR